MSNITKTNKSIYLLIFSLAFTLRLIFLYLLNHNYSFYSLPSADVFYYKSWAEEITFTNFVGFKTFWGLPLYPYVLAVLYRLFLGNELLIHVFFILIGSINCLFIKLISDKMFSSKVGILASILMATNFTLIYYDWLLMPVTLTIFLSCVIIYFLLDTTNHDDFKNWIYFGIISGLSILIDGKFIIFFAFIVSVSLLNTVKNKSCNLKLDKKFISLLIMLAMIFSVTIRNRIVGGSWVAITAQSGLSFFVGNNQNATGYYDNPTFIRPNHVGQDVDQRIYVEHLLGKKLTDKQISDYFNNQAINFITKNPKQYFKILFNKSRIFFNDSQLSYDLDLLFLRHIKKSLDLNSFYIIIPFALLGFFINIKNKKSIHINLIILSQLIFTLVFFLTNRHRSSILPFLIIYESVFVFWIIDQFKQKNHRNILISLFTILAILTFNQPITMNESIIKHLELSQLGYIKEKLGNIKEAQKNYLAALEINPNDASTLYNLGNAYLKNDQFDEALNYYNKALAIQPLNIDAKYNKAIVLEKLKDPGSAFRLYKELLTLQPNNVDIYYRIALIYKNAKQCLKLDNFVSQITPNIEQNEDLIEFKKLIHTCNQ